jgi:prepilin-type processing-associated H-X9-DG protein
LGISFVIHTAGSVGHVNDFERLGQYSGTNGNGTSYEYGCYYSRVGLTTKLSDFWHVKMYKRDIWEDRGIYTTNVLSPAPWEKGLLSDADDSDNMAYLAGLGHITGADYHATNNVPEPWDNHGAYARNSLYADGHVVTTKYFP